MAPVLGGGTQGANRLGNDLKKRTIMSLTLASLLGFTANITSNIAFIPQIIRSYRRKTVDDLSIGMFITLVATQLCWIGYALPINAVHLWVSSLIEIILLIPILVMWFKYRSK